MFRLVYRKDVKSSKVSRSVSPHMPTDGLSSACVVNQKEFAMQVTGTRSANGD